MVSSGWNFPLVGRVRAEIRGFSDHLNGMGPKGHNPFRTDSDPLIPPIMQAVIVHQHIVSVLIDDLSLDPLPGCILNINPLTHLQFPPLQLEGTDIFHEVMIDALH